ncbi:MAG TPA: DNA polymerase Y family protein [Candidatus Binataceae bacterium]|nr:DNA polymerase Y family protein [Candidatus Binataceae bacterium]
MDRIACILVTDFSIAALVRANPALDGAVLAISHSLAPHAELVAVSPRARTLGMRPGMTIAQARAISSELAVTAHSPAAERSAHDALADAAESVSPVVEPGAPGCVWLDLAGMERIHASEAELASEIVRRVRRVGMEAAVGIAAGKEIAHLAARCGGIRIIEPGMERQFLDWLPLDALNLGASERGGDLEMTLARWGLRRLGDLARLDPDAIGSRLGRRGVELVRLARGGSPAPLVARPHAEAFAEAIELEYGIDNLEAMGFVVRPIFERLVERLELRGLVAGDIMLALGLCGHRIASRRIAVAAPSNDVRAMLTLLTLSLESNPPAAAVESIRIEVQPRIPRPAQSDMFLPPAPAPDRLQTTIARLAALCGPGNVGALMPQNSHRPEALRLDPYDPPPPAPPSNGAHPRNGAAASNAARLVMRAIRPAIEVEVMCLRGGPEFVRGANLGARVVSCAGPWRRDGEWWKRASEEARLGGAAGFVRDYYELALDDGGVYRVFRDINSDRWFVDGVYD